jgi:Flp pilus assembly protein TadD
MGDININHLKDLDAAERNFETILKEDPQHVQARHNLCVVYVERGDLLRAETCLADVLHLAPHEKYIEQHLAIVRNRIKKQQQRPQEQQSQQAP